MSECLGVHTNTEYVVPRLLFHFNSLRTPAPLSKTKVRMHTNNNRSGTNRISRLHATRTLTHRSAAILIDLAKLHPKLLQFLLLQVHGSEHVAVPSDAAFEVVLLESRGPVPHQACGDEIAATPPSSNQPYAPLASNLYEALGAIQNFTCPASNLKAWSRRLGQTQHVERVQYPLLPVFFLLFERRRSCVAAAALSLVNQHDVLRRYYEPR